jgi:hypothetical protein
LLKTGDKINDLLKKKKTNKQMNNVGIGMGGNMQDMMKSSMLTMGMMSGMNNNPGGNSTSSMGAQNNSMLTMVFGMIAMSVMENGVTALKELGKYGKLYMSDRIRKKKEQLEKKIKCLDPAIASSILFEVSEENRHIEKIKAIIDYMCEQNSAIKLRFGTGYTIYNNDIFELGFKDVKCIIKESIFDDKGKIDKLNFEIFSKELELSKLKRWLKNIEKDYILEQQNQLGDKKFFFNEIPEKVNYGPGGKLISNGNAPQKLRFTMTEFKTNKSLRNMYGPEITPIKKMVDLFEKNPEWYEKRGIPHTLGFLFYGEPGCGKSSSIKAIAKDTERHIFNIALRPNTTKTQIHNLFFCDKIQIETEDGHRITCNIPLDKRIYVLEDVDCLTDVVLSRKLKNFEDNELISTSEPQSNSNSNSVRGYDPYALSQEYIGNDSFSQQVSKVKIPQDTSDLLNLSFLLNLLDGILETPGRMLIMTSNHPEKLDSALIRPGRIDLMIEFGKCCTYTIRSMFKAFFDLSESDLKQNKFEFKPWMSNLITPAALSKTLSINYLEPRVAYECMIKKLKDTIIGQKNIEIEKKQYDSALKNRIILLEELVRDCKYITSYNNLITNIDLKLEKPSHVFENSPVIEPIKDNIIQFQLQPQDTNMRDVKNLILRESNSRHIMIPNI